MMIQDKIGFDRKCSVITDSRSVMEELCAIGTRKNECSKKIINLVSSNIIFIWVPSHLGVHGNELVDEFALDLANQVEDDIYENNCLTVADYKSIVRKFSKEDVQRNWLGVVENKLRAIYPSSEYFPSWNVNGKDQMVVNRLRAGHTYLTHDYLIAKVPRPKCKACNLLLTIEHLFECTVDVNNSYYLTTSSRDLEG